MGVGNQNEYRGPSGNCEGADSCLESLAVLWAFPPALAAFLLPENQAL